MKNLLILLALWPLLALSAPVTIDLQNVPMKDLIRLVYGELLGVNYVLDSTIQDDLKPVSLSLKNVEPKEAEVVLKGLLATQAIGARNVGGVYLVNKQMPDEEPKEVFIYRPLHRSVQYLTELTSTMFPQGAFVTQRGGGKISIGQVTGNSSGMQQSAQQGMQQGVQSVQNGAENLAGTVPGINQGMNKVLDTEADTLVFNGNIKDIIRLKKLLADLDTETGEVMVKAVIYEVQTSNKEGSAIDLAVALLSGLTNKVGIAIDGAAASAGSSVFAKFKTGSIDANAVFTALSSDDRFKVVSSPRVRVRSGASAHFSVGDETPVLGSVSYDQNGRPIQSVSYKSSGVIFDLKPQVREQGVDLHLSQQISSFIPTTTGVNGTPTLTKRELSTDLTIADGEMVVIGGLESDKDTKSNSGLSFLPTFFRSDTAQTSRTEIVLMLHLQRI